MHRRVRDGDTRLPPVDHSRGAEQARQLDEPDHSDDSKERDILCVAISALHHDLEDERRLAEKIKKEP
eukprot:1567588-Prymnesium_polylepis.1